MARLLALSLTVTLWAACGTTVFAQEAQPADGVPPVEPDPNAPIVAPEKSPLVKEPTTPDEMFEAVELMLEVGRPQIARMYLDRLLETNPDDDTLNHLREKYGTSAFLRLVQAPELKPSAGKLLDLSNAAAARYLRDPARTAALIEKLGGSPLEAGEAILALRGVGVTATPPLIQILNDPAREAVHPAALRALVEIGRPAVPPLLAALDSPNPSLRAQASTALGYLRSLEAEPYLWAPAMADASPAVRQAARSALAQILKLPRAQLESLATGQVLSRLIASTREYSQHKHQWRLDPERKVTLWVYDPQEQVVIPRVLDPVVADEILASRFSKLAVSMAPERRDVQVAAISAALAADSRLAGHGNVLPRGPATAYELAVTSGMEVIDAVLLDAVKTGNPIVALAALEALEGVATKELLKPGTGLVAALNAPDRRVQFAAAVGVLRIDPKEPFTSSSRVVSILHRALENEQRPRAVVVQSSPDKASELGGFLSELGYESIVRFTGRDGFRDAAARGDVEVIVLHVNIVRWVLSETLANLRADTRTSTIPVVVIGPESLRVKMGNVLEKYPLTFFVAEQTEVGGFASQLKPFVSRIAAPLTEAELVDQKAAAVSWLANLAARRRTRIFPLTGLETSLSRTLNDDVLAAETLTALAELGSVESQRLLEAVTADTTAPVARRIDAAGKLASHVQRYGLLLSQSQVARLHALLAAETAPELHAALAAVIGTLKPDPTLVGKRLQRSTSP